MSRIARVCLAGVPYHVTQRGNGGQQVFLSASDYRLYLDLFRIQAGRNRLVVWAYCLMPNHVHFVVVPDRETALSRALGRTHAEYAQHFNLARRSCGHVWQARFFSCPLDGQHLWLAMAYIERNPVRAGLAPEAASYRWSSAAAHVSGEDPDRLLDLGAWNRQYTAERWRRVLETTVAEEALAERLREATLRGRPLGAEEFVDQLEEKTARRLRPRAAGRPRKSEDPGLQLPLEIGV